MITSPSCLRVRLPAQRRGLGLLLLALSMLLAAPVAAQGDAPTPPWAAADAVRDALFAAQAALLGNDPAAAADQVAVAIAAAPGGLPPNAAALLDTALDEAATAARAGDSNALAGARGLVQGAIYWGAYLSARTAVETGDADAAGRWLLVRDFRTSTRFSRPDADATLALRALADGATAGAMATALAQLDADLLDTYQARLGEHLATAANPSTLSTRRAEAAGLAAATWRILAPAYTAQTAADPADVTAAFDGLLPALLSGDENAVAATAARLVDTLATFRAAPLSPDDQARRAGQLLRYLALVPVEYGRGVTDQTVMIDLEVQEAVTFMRGAEAAFADLRLNLAAIDAAQTEALAGQITTAMADLDAANRKAAVLTPETMTANIQTITTGLTALFPPEWTTNADADFDVLASVLDQMEAAAAAGDYTLAESARLEGYAIFDFGPEPRLLGFAPPLVARIDGLFWQGYGGQTGLAQAIALQASPAKIAAIRADLDIALNEAQLTLGDLPSAPGAIITNAAIIVFREGLESVVILAALMASMVGAMARHRRPMVLGVLLSLLATAVTWWLAQQSSRR